MKFVGNYKNWITPELMNHLKSHEGDHTPVWQPERWQGHPVLDEYREKARWCYSKNTPMFHQFNARSIDMQEFKVVLPELPESRAQLQWWFVKLYPGEMQAMHVDPHLLSVSNPVRYTMFLEDFVPGHIFVYDDKLMSNYKAGDMYEWSDPMIVHGVSNISYTTRYTLQITLHD
jgi:hypothetical protein